MSNSGADPGQATYTSGTGYLLSRLGRLAERTWSAHLAAAGLTQLEYGALAVLAEQTGLTQQAVARRVGQDPRNLVATVARLTERRLVEAAVDESDRRRKLLSLTEEGRSRIAKLTDALHAGQGDILAPLTDAEREQLRTLLLRVHDHASED